MANRFTEGKRAIAECDRCGFRFKLHDLKKLVVKTKQINMLVCSECWEEDHPQLQLGMYPIADPQALRDPRPDFAGYPESRDIQWGWNPVGGGNGFVGTPNTLQSNTAVGSVSVVTVEDTIAYPIGLSIISALGTPTVDIINPSDPYYSNVVLLLHMDGTSGSTTFVDNSPTPKTVSPFGNTNVNTSVYKYGTGSAYFDGNFDGMYANSTDFRFGTGDFTIEFWLYIANLGSAQQKAISANASSGSDSWRFYLNADKTLSFRMDSISPIDIQTAFTLSAGAWYFISATRASTRVRLFVDGVNINPSTTYTSTRNMNVISDVIIGSDTLLNTNAINGYIDDYRITKGVARYTADFTPPTSAFSNS